MENSPLQVSDAIALFNQTLEYAYPVVVIEGEVASFKVNQNKYVFFDLKDESGTLGCFMTVYQLRIPLEDGMRVRVLAQPKITQWGKFSLTIREIQPVGEGSLKRAFELLRSKLDKEGLFAPERKRRLPEMPQTIAVISSTQAAGYADFVNILSSRWGGVDVIVAHTQVQGMSAPQQIVRALEYFNQLAELPDVVAIIRGGGSADDLSAFNDEPLVRAIASSRIPVITGIGHETDTSLSDMAADVAAVTPSNAAQLLVPDKRDIARAVDDDVSQMLIQMQRHVVTTRHRVETSVQRVQKTVDQIVELRKSRYAELSAVLTQLDPRAALRRGYALVRAESGKLLIDNKPKIGEGLAIETAKYIIETGVKDVREKS